MLLSLGICLAYYNSQEMLTKVSSRIYKVMFVVFVGEYKVGHVVGFRFTGGRGIWRKDSGS